MSNPNIFVVTTDWHVTSNDSETGGLGETKPSQAAAVVSHIRGLDPAGVIDMGDCKDHYGSGTGDEHDQYIANVRNTMPWATLNSGFNATAPILPGNHDEVIDYLDAGGSTDFSIFDSKFWAAPYHWTCDWAAPQIRFIAFHAYIIHEGANAGLFNLDADERTWLTAELAALPVGWKAIVVCHPPMLTTFGNEILPASGGTELLAILAANNTKIAACLNGHRHFNMSTAVQDSIRHICCPGMSYSTSNGLGGFVIVEYIAGGPTLKFHMRTGPPGFYGAFGGYTPLTVAL